MSQSKDQPLSKQNDFERPHDSKHNSLQLQPPQPPKNIPPADLQISIHIDDKPYFQRKSRGPARLETSRVGSLIQSTEKISQAQRQSAASITRASVSRISMALSGISIELSEHEDKEVTQESGLSFTTDKDHEYPASRSACNSMSHSMTSNVYVAPNGPSVPLPLEIRDGPLSVPLPLEVRGVLRSGSLKTSRNSASVSRNRSSKATITMGIRTSQDSLRAKKPEAARNAARQSKASLSESGRSISRFNESARSVVSTSPGASGADIGNEGGMRRQIITEEDKHLMPPNNDYYEYLMLNQRHASSHFITKLGSQDVNYPDPGVRLKIIGPYVMGDQIGKGAYGKVKEGLCGETLQRVAIKIINKRKLRKIPNGVENVLSEIKLLSGLSHKNIINLIDVYCKVEDDEGNTGIFRWFSDIENELIVWTYDDGSIAEKQIVLLKWYLIFDYCPCSLQTLIEQADDGKLSLAKAHQRIRVLACKKYNTFVYVTSDRDIKAGNLLITPDSVLKISDFGVAESCSIYESGILKTEKFAGTPRFISPEIIDGAAHIAGEKGIARLNKVDMWASGVTLFNMITGSYPFDFPSDDETILGLYHKIQAGQYDDSMIHDNDLKALIKGLLNTNPIDRFSISDARDNKWVQQRYEEVPQRVQMYPVKPIAISEVSLEHQKTTPCETTMIKFLTELYGKEIEDDLQERKRFIDIEGVEIPVSVKSQVKQKKKLQWPWKRSNKIGC